ncbi:MAG: YCF48-related protein [Chloroflexi bacterium]|nr:YCF48-related protein [Chloroflexota bacterium]
MSAAKTIYIGMHDGVCSVTSEDGGSSWQQGPVTALPHAAARLAASRVNPQRAWLAAYEAGVYRTDDGGKSWTRLDSYPSPYAHSVLAHPTEEDTLFVGSEPATVYRSDDSGDTWTELEGFTRVPESVDWGFHSPTRDSHVRDLRVAPNDANRLYAGIEVGGMVCSGDGGANWQQLPGLNDDIHCVALSDARPESVYVATARAPYRSSDGGANWQPINEGLDRRYTLHISPAPDDASLVLVTVSENARRLNPMFYRSTDGGDSWQLVDEVGQGTEPAEMVVAFEWDPSDPSRVYAGADGGQLYQSTDRGVSWEELPVRLSSVAVGALAVSGG